MAMTTCPECKKELSENAYFCPHCGCPINALPVPPADKNEYRLLVGNVSDDSGFPAFLRILGVIAWIGGLIIAIIGGRNPLTSEFSFGQFLIVLIPYIINGALLFGFAQVVEKIGIIHNMIYGLKLEKDIPSSKTGGQNKSTSVKRSVFAPKPGKDWKCPSCGCLNPSTALSCKDCGKYR